MSNSREESPDWLRSFQAPTHSTLTLSSDSNGSPSREDNDDHEQPFLHKSPKRDNIQDKPHAQSGVDSPSNEISKTKSLKNQLNIDHNQRPRKKKKILGNGDHKQVADEITSEKHIESHNLITLVDRPRDIQIAGTLIKAVNHSVWTLSSDSEACPDNSALREEKTLQFPECEKVEDTVLIGRGQESPSEKALNKRSPNKRVKVKGQTPKKEKNVNDNVKREGNGGEVEVAEEELAEKHIEPHVSTSRLPLMLSEKVHRSKALVECEGESIDLSGDMGAVGRIVIPDTPSENREMYLDLKGTIYKTTIVPSRTFCVVSFGQSEAKIEAIMNDFIQLKPQSNVYEAETMVEGTLDGFSFDSEDEAEKMSKAISHETDQNEGIEEQTEGKTKGKADKKSGVARKRGKTVGGKPQPPKKVKKKAQVSKKTKTKK